MSRKYSFYFAAVNFIFLTVACATEPAKDCSEKEWTSDWRFPSLKFTGAGDKIISFPGLQNKGLNMV